MSQGRRAPTSTGYDAEEAEGFEDATGLRDIATPEAQLMSKQIAQIVNQTIDKLPEELKLRSCCARLTACRMKKLHR